MHSHNNEIQSNATRPTLIKGLQASKEKSWDQFYDSYAPLIVNFARKRGCSSTQAEDVLQETVLAVIRVIPNFDLQNKKGKFRSLLFKITESKVIDAYRRSKRDVIVEDPEIINKYQGIDVIDNAASRHMWDNT
jgi:RNA polymerase sigma factor (sigma-70 family)